MLSPFQIRTRQALLENPFFRALPDECLRWVQRTAVRKDEMLFKKGQPSDSLFGIVSGRVNLCSIGADGREIAFGFVAPGETFGEIGISRGSPRHTNAVAATHSELATLRRCDLESLLDRYPGLRKALLEASAETTRRLSARIEDDAVLGIEARVEKTLFDIVRRFSEQPEDRKPWVQVRR